MRGKPKGTMRSQVNERGTGALPEVTRKNSIPKRIETYSQLTKRSQFCELNIMSSLKQIAANRRNALKSTGPTTEEGKEHSRCNAVRHGLTAETVIADLEDAADYQAYEAAVIADYDAQTAVDRELVLRLASVLWRLRRAIGLESGIFESATPESVKDDDPLSGGAQVNPATDRLYVVCATHPLGLSLLVPAARARRFLCRLR